MEVETENEFDNKEENAENNDLHWNEEENDRDFNGGKDDGDFNEAEDDEDFNEGEAINGDFIEEEGEWEDDVVVTVTEALAKRKGGINYITEEFFIYRKQDTK